MVALLWDHCVVWGRRPHRGLHLLDVGHSPLIPAGRRESILRVLSNPAFLGSPPLLSSLKLGLLHGAPLRRMERHTYIAQQESREVRYRRVPSRACPLQM